MAHLPFAVKYRADDSPDSVSFVRNFLRMRHTFFFFFFRAVFIFPDRHTVDVMTGGRFTSKVLAARIEM